MVMAGGSATLQSLEKDLKRGARSFYLFTSEQSWILDEAIRMLRSGLQIESSTGYEYRSLDVRSRWEDIESLLRNYSFFEGPKLVHLDVPRKLDQDFKDLLNDFLEESPGPNALCLTAPGLKQVLAAKNRIAKAGGLVLNFSTLKGKTLEAWVRGYLRSKGIEFEPSVPGELLGRLPGDPGDLAAEIEKLSLVAAKGRLTVALVDRLVAYHPELNVFRLTDSLRKGREAEMIGILGELLDFGGFKPVPLTALLGATMTQILKASILLEQGLPEGEIRRRMGGNPYVAGKAIEQARGGTRREYVAWILNLKKLDGKLKGVVKERSRALMESYLLESMSGHILSA